MRTISDLPQEIQEKFERHRKWLRNGEVGDRADFSGTDLSDLDLSSLDLTDARLNSANLAGSDLRLANLTGAIMDSADLSSANLEEAILCKAHLYEANLSSARLKGADLTRAKLEDCNFENADLTESNLTDASVSRVKLEGATLADTIFGDELSFDDYTWIRAGISPEDNRYYQERLVCAVRNGEVKHLKGLFLKKADFTKCCLVKVDFSEACLEEVDFSGSVLKKCNFHATNLKNAIMEDTEFREGCLSGAKLDGVDMTCVRLTEHVVMIDTKLTYAKIEGADFSQCDQLPEWVKSGKNEEGIYLKSNLVRAIKAGFKKLEWANLRDLTLKGVDLRNADLNHADLEKSNLEDTDLSGANLQFAVLNGCRLIDTVFRKANLFRTTIKGANLKGADFRNTDIRELRHLETAPNAWEIMTKNTTLSSGQDRYLNMRRLIMLSAFKKDCTDVVSWLDNKKDCTFEDILTLTPEEFQAVAWKDIKAYHPDFSEKDFQVLWNKVGYTDSEKTPSTSLAGLKP